MKRLLPFIYLFFLQLIVVAQKPATITSADIYLGLKKLAVLSNVLYVAAHPDDENTRLLTYFAKERLYRTGYLSLTRGDGGQNLIGDEQGIALGLIRTQELLSARRIDGAEQFFTRAYDFGFSKNPEETFTKWDKEKVLADVVWVIRKFRPDIIITRFPTTGEGGHGHHTASAILANEAFEAAADPKRFPEQLKYVEPWQAKRILLNGFGGNNGQGAQPFRLDVGAFNAVIGKSYGEIASESRSQHKSQGFGVAATRGEAFESFVTTKGTAPVTDVMDGVDVSWKRVPNSDRIAQKTGDLVQTYDFAHPEKSVPALHELYKELAALPASNWKTQKLDEVQQLIAQCSGLWLEATTNQQNIVQGDSMRVTFSINNRSGANLNLQKIVVEGFDTLLNVVLPANKNINFTKSIPVSIVKPISQPYWLSEQMDKGLFTVSQQTLIGQPDVTPPFVANFVIGIQGTTLSYENPVRYKYTDPVRGELYEPLSVVPPATIISSPDVMVLRLGQNQTKEALVRLNANTLINTNNAVTEMRSKNYNLTKKDSLFSLEKGRNKELAFSINNKHITAQANENIPPTLRYSHKGVKLEADIAQTGMDYQHIPSIRYFYHDNINLLHLNLKTAGKKIGYIVGAGDRVPEALEQMDYEVTLLTDKELARNNLAQYDAIITGVRAYNTNAWMNQYYDKFMKYVQDGGNLIVQYNTSSQIGPVRAKMGPYNFNISRTRVTDENATVTFLNPQHPVLNYPNKITTDDFKGWIQERSIYHANDLDKNFEPIFSMADPGEKADNGSLVIAKYGKGFFTYTGIVFFRELPAGVAGAYRLMANLIALNHQNTF